MPIFARGRYPSRPRARMVPGEINVPVSCASMAVLPGDLIVGDADGVIAVPAAEAADVLRRTRLHLEREAGIRETELPRHR